MKEASGQGKPWGEAPYIPVGSDVAQTLDITFAQVRHRVRIDPESGDPIKFSGGRYTDSERAELERILVEGAVEDELRQAGAINDLQRGESKIRIVMVLTSVVLIIGLAFYGIKMTHKVAGPLFKVSLYLNKMRDGRFDKVWNLRKGDQLIDFYEHFKAAHAGVVTLQQGDIAALHAFIAAADAAHQASPMSADVVAKVDELRVLVTKKEKSLE